jgi:hypothetical protein
VFLAATIPLGCATPTRLRRSGAPPDWSSTRTRSVHLSASVPNPLSPGLQDRVRPACPLRPGALGSRTPTRRFLSHLPPHWIVTEPRGMQLRATAGSPQPKTDQSCRSDRSARSGSIHNPAASQPARGPIESIELPARRICCDGVEGAAHRPARPSPTPCAGGAHRDSAVGRLGSGSPTRSHHACPSPRP